MLTFRLLQAAIDSQVSGSLSQEQFMNKATLYKVPHPIANALWHYYKDRIIPSDGFVQAILENNFTEACKLAPTVYAGAVAATRSFITETLPAMSWGTKLMVQAWISNGRSNY